MIGTPALGRVGRERTVQSLQSDVCRRCGANWMNDPPSVTEVLVGCSGTELQALVRRKGKHPGSLPCVFTVTGRCFQGPDGRHASMDQHAQRCPLKYSIFLHLLEKWPQVGLPFSFLLFFFLFCVPENRLLLWLPGGLALTGLWEGGNGKCVISAQILTNPGSA